MVVRGTSVGVAIGVPRLATPVGVVAGVSGEVGGAAVGKAGVGAGMSVALGDGTLGVSIATIGIRVIRARVDVGATVSVSGIAVRMLVGERIGDGTVGAGRAAHQSEGKRNDRQQQTPSRYHPLS
jgi:hypothetical protein